MSTSAIVHKQHSLESRIFALESCLGLLQSKSSNNPSSVASTKDLTTRLDTLELKLKSFSIPQTIWSESDKLIQELQPHTGFTYQELSTRNDPIIYRRQQVLACADDLKRDFAQLNTIMNLLLISQTKSNRLSEEQITHAPIVVTTQCKTEDQVRLDKLQLKILHTHQQTLAIAKRVDSLVQTYHVIVTSLSEQTINLYQTISDKGCR
jgi:Dynactin subunit p22